METPPPVPNGPRDRLPPFLRRYCPDRDTLTRFAGACARGWSAIDGTGRVFLVCTIGLFLLVALLPSVALWGFAIAGLLVFGLWTRRWRALDRRGRLFVVCGNLASVIALALAIGGWSDKGTPPDPPDVLAGDGLVPHLPDETKLIGLKTNVEAFVGKAFVLCGVIRATTADVYYRSERESGRYTFSFTECGRIWRERTDTVIAYLVTARGERIADRIIETQVAWGERARLRMKAINEVGVVNACRVRATILKTPFLQWDRIEILDVQFPNASGDGWEPWVLGTPDSEPATSPQPTTEKSAQRRSHASKAIIAVFVFREFHLPPDVDWDKAITEAAEAIPKCTEDIRLHPQKIRTYQDRGLARCVTGEWKAGIADLTEAIWLDPKNAEGYNLRAFVRCAIGEWEPAIADLTEAIRLDPQGDKYYALRSVAYAKRGDVQKALRDREHLKDCMYPMDEVTGLAEVLEETWPSP